MKCAAFFILIFFLTSCASYLSQSESTKSLLRQGQTTQALNNLKTHAAEPGRDQLVYLLDYAMLLQMTGQYKESTTIFQKADILTEQNDYHSVSNIVGSTLGSEEMIQYKGESFEKFLINSMNAINYLMLGDYDAALVECRRINNKISAFKMEGRDPYELSAFARYLSAIIWESQKKYDDAYIEYEGAYALDKSIATIKSDLIRTAKLAQREDKLVKWKEEFLQDKTALSAANIDKSKGEVVVLFQQGFGAKKIPRSDEPRFPTLQAEYLKTTVGLVSVYDSRDVSGVSTVVPAVKTQTVYDIDQMAMITLNKDYNSLVLRRIGGIVAKAVVSEQIRQKNDVLGNVAWIAMNLADRADLRQWSTLPARIQVARLFLKPGKYQIKIQGLDSYDQPTADAMPSQTIEVKSGKKVFVNYRSLR